MNENGQENLEESSFLAETLKPADDEGGSMKRKAEELEAVEIDSPNDQNGATLPTKRAKSSGSPEPEPKPEPNPSQPEAESSRSAASQSKSSGSGSPEPNQGIIEPPEPTQPEPEPSHSTDNQGIVAMEIETGKEDPPAAPAEALASANGDAVLPTPANRAPTVDTSRHLSQADPDGVVAREQDTVESTPTNSSSNSKAAGSMVMDLETASSDNKTKLAPPASTLDPPAEKAAKNAKSGNNQVQSSFQPLASRKAAFDRMEQEDSSEKPSEKRPTRSRSSSRNQPSEVVSSLLELPKLSSTATLPPLKQDEQNELESVLAITPEDPWREDWSGNLALVDKEIVNPKRSRNGKDAGTFCQPLYIWAQKSNSAALKNLHALFRYVYHLKDTPPMAKTILANADKKDGHALESAFRRVSYDPTVLQQDGWTTAKAPIPVGSSGGAYRIAEKVRWQGADGIVIAYVHDNDLGDLWRGIWLEDGMESFDMEAEELIDARRKWERRAKAEEKAGRKQAEKQHESNKQAKQQTQQGNARRSHRYNAANEINIDGVEQGIVLAASFAKGARPGVYWPARVMHASEAAVAVPGAKNKRSAPRQRLDLVFLAPYWNSGSAAATSNRSRAVESFSESLSRHGESLFSSGPLFEVESVDVAEDMIKAYPYDGRDGGINIDQLRVAFRFTGLPKVAFSRFLDSHRLALALRTYAQEELPPRGSNQASAGLFETHPMSVTAPIFPPQVLHLPYVYMLSQLPAPPCEQNVHDGEHRNHEPVLRLQVVIDSMKPPSCWGQDKVKVENGSRTPKSKLAKVAESPFLDTGTLLRQADKDGAKPIELEHFTKDLSILKEAMVGGGTPGLQAMIQNLQSLLSSVRPAYAKLNDEEKQGKARSLARSWVFTKANGEDAIVSSGQSSSAGLLSEWRRACERVYKYMTHAFSSSGYGNGVSFVLTDYRCNQHVTSCGCFERTVRLPAALKAARDVGAGRQDNVQLTTTVDKSYLDKVENEVLMKAHSASYLRRMKSRCSQIQGDNIVYLTEDSDGNGGEDTKGTRGTWMAAVASVGAAVKAVDMVVEGKCVNAFCATRPPGHHAGRDLHPMKAVSNGFCILNTAACAALYATTPLSEGGPGLRRVCIIDFDVHHGNGTQDILCSTYDPRFLYVSLHAGGADVNGLPASDDFGTEIHQPGGNSAKKGIYPGRCGDSSPHKGVLNIPLGPRVNSHAVGTALINQVTPAVDSFSPDLIILSAGFDAHKNDPLGLGGLSADGFGHITDVACHLASKCCSGRVISLLEGGYGVPCCRPQKNLFLPPSLQGDEKTGGAEGKKKEEAMADAKPTQTEEYQRPQPSKLLDLGGDLPDDMEDQVPYALQRRLERCHAEGFVECVHFHLKSLVKCNTRS